MPSKRMQRPAVLARKREHCRGCRNDYYNQGNNGMGGKGCWSLPSAKLVTRFRTHRDALPASPGAFEQVRVYQCYHAPPFYFQERVQDFVKAEDVINSPAWKRKQARDARIRERAARPKPLPAELIECDPDDIPF
jgi:hypothetical protein